MKTIIIKKFLTTVICAVFLLSLFLSCNTGVNIQNESGQISGDDLEAESISSISYEIPSGNYGGSTVNILVPSYIAGEFHVESENGEIVNDAIYSRDAEVMENLNVNLNYIKEEGNWNDRVSYNNKIISSVLADDKAYDFIITMWSISMSIISEGYFLNINDVDSINMENPWWVGRLNEQLAINGKLYVLTGDASLSMYTTFNVFLCNKDLIKNYEMEEPYRMVRSGNWTFDKLMEQTKDLTHDLNGDSIIDNNDFYGYVSVRVPARSLQSSLGIEIIKLNNGIPYIVDPPEKLMQAVDKMETYMKNTSVVLWETEMEDNVMNMFRENRVVYISAYLYNMEHLRDWEGDFGVIPYPKYDTSQEDYYTQIGTSSMMFVIPITCEDTAMTGTVMEYLGYESYLNVIPSYYEVALKEKYSRDEEVKEMLDIIRQGAHMDTTFGYNNCFSPPLTTILTNILSPVTDEGGVSSYYAKNLPAWEAQLEEYIKLFK